MIMRFADLVQMLGESEQADYSARNAGPSPSSVADSPSPATPGGHYTHVRHLSWPRTHSIDSFSAVSYEDRSTLSGRIEFAEGQELGRHLEEECRRPGSPRSRQLCFSPRTSWQPNEIAWDARNNAPLHGRSNEPRVLPSITRSTDVWPSEWRPFVASRNYEREEQPELARRRRTGDPRQQLYSADAANDCWMATLALQSQTRNGSDRVSVLEGTTLGHRASFADTRAPTNAALPVDPRSRSDPPATEFYQPPRHGHSRSVSLMYDRPGPWLYDGHEGHPYRASASGPGNPFAPPNTYPGGGYIALPGYHVGGHRERSEGSGPLAEMAKRKKRGNLPPEAKKTMMAWFKNHLHHPYPDEETKKKWITETGLSPGKW